MLDARRTLHCPDCLVGETGTGLTRCWCCGGPMVSGSVDMPEMLLGPRAAMIETRYRLDLPSGGSR